MDLEFTNSAHASGRGGSMGSGWEDCACSQARIHGKDTQNERVCDTPPPLCPTVASHTWSSSPRPAAPPLSQYTTPVPWVLVPNLLQPMSSSIVFVNTSKLYPKASRMPHTRAPQCSCPTSPPALSARLCTHHKVSSLWMSPSTPTPYPGATSPAGGPAVVLVLIIDYWFCGLCCPPSKLWHPSCIHCHILISRPSQPNSCPPRTLHESCSDFCFKIWTQATLAQNLPGSALKKLKIGHLQEWDIWKL